MKNYKIIFPLLVLGFFITSCNTGIDGRYKLMYSAFYSGEYYFDEDGTYTLEMEFKEGSFGGKGTGKDEGTWWLDTTDLDGNKVTSVEFMKDPESHNVWLNHKVNDGKFNKNHKTNFFLIKGRDNRYPELWEDGKKSCYKTFFPF